MEGSRYSGRFCTRWLNEVKEAGVVKSLDLRDAKLTCNDRELWPDFVNGTNDGTNVGTSLLLTQNSEGVDINVGAAVKSRNMDSRWK